MPITAGELLALVDRFDWEAYADGLKDAVGNTVTEIVAIQGARGAARAGGQFSYDDPFVKKHLTKYVGERIVSLNDTTKSDVSDLVRSLIADGTSVADLGDRIADKVREKFKGYEDWRADRIARSETAIAYNFGNTLGYRQSGVEEVEVSDGDDDAACREANGQIWPLERALAEPIAHPGCVRDFAPVLSSAE